MDEQPLDPAIQTILLPEEQVLWTGGYDTSYTRNQNFRNGVISNATFILVLAGIVYFFSHGNRSDFDILDLIETTLIVASIPLTIYAGITAIRLRRRAAQPPPTEYPILRYMLTDRRALVHDYSVRTTWAVFLGDVQIRQNKPSGDIAFFPAIRTRKTQSILLFTRLADTADVYQRITNAQTRYTDSAPIKDSALPPTVQATLLPDEQVLWSGTPVPAERDQRASWRDVGNVVAIFLAILTAFYLIAGGYRYDLGEYLRFLLLISCLPIGAVVISVVVTQQIQRFQSAHHRPEPPPAVFYVVTDRRALLHYLAEKATASLLLATADVTQNRRRDGHHVISFYPTLGFVPAKRARITRFEAFAFVDVPDAAAVHRLILAAQAQLNSS